VVVNYTSDSEIQTGKSFAEEGMQIAAGVPLQCDEPADFRTFRIGLFGLDKLYDVPGTLARLSRVVDQVLEPIFTTIFAIAFSDAKTQAH
jgi:aspartate aminotransferase-like enzyme